MPKIEKTIFIAAPPEKVFAFMVDPGNLIEIWPSLLELRNVQPLPTGGYCFDWTYKMAGMRFQGTTMTTEFVKDQRIATKSESGIQNNLVWNYQPQERGTRATVSVDYAVPANVLGRLAEPIVHKYNQKECETILANLKARMEA